MVNKQLIGNWYIKKKLFGFDVMVEATYQTVCDFDFSFSPTITKYIKATEDDLFKLNIRIPLNKASN